MSLVNYLVSEDFIIFCGEQRAINTENGEIEGNNFIKVRKSRRNVLFGFMGRTNHIYAFCYPFLNMDLSLSLNTLECDYNQIKNHLKSRILQVEEEIFDYSIAVCIGGWDGEKLCIAIFHVDKNVKTLSDEIYASKENEVRFGTLSFNPDHYKNFKSFLEANPGLSINNYKNAFKKTVEMGAKHDNTISTNCVFEVLNKKDIRDHL